ncbi:hypothetical protein CLV98_103203 [Dyadobacter jejuensis]|uniref:Uncharacterized protein n=1 Tax=Dyadobacter jejuensis TaxID=1082580 RepID=A0A316AMN8_9BACT|nr:hypothetical protein [Dyadobacter jejuensis]PWJ58836.1 hypothetical protein CLV98_103203 [Dyadobacter jejuensis]
MTHEKIIERDGQTQIKISVWLYVYQNESKWGFLVLIKDKDSDQWLDPFAYETYQKKRGKVTESSLHPSATVLATEKEIQEVKLELWKKIKPL